MTTSEQAELAAAKRRIRELEAEIAIHRRATELLKEKLAEWDRFYNYDRPHGAHRGRTPY